MAATIDSANVASQHFNANSVNSFNVVVGSQSNRVALVAIHTETRNVTGVTLGGAAMTLVNVTTSSLADTSGHEVVWYRLINPSTSAGAALEVTVNSALNSGAGQNVFYVPMYDVDQTTPVEANAIDTDEFATASSASLTTVSASALILAVLGTYDNRAITNGTGHSTVVEYTGAADQVPRARVSTKTGPGTPGAVTSEFTVSSSSARLVQSAIVIKSAAAAATTLTRRGKPRGVTRGVTRGVS